MEREVRRVMSSTGLDRETVTRWHQQFTQQVPTGQLTRSHLQAALLSALPEFAATTVMAELLGGEAEVITFPQWAACCWTWLGLSVEQRLTQLFRLLDRRRCGRVSLADIGQQHSKVQ